MSDETGIDSCLIPAQAGRDSGFASGLRRGCPEWHFYRGRLCQV